MFSKYQDITGSLNYFIFLVLMAVLPYSYDLIRVTWVVWLISYIIQFPFFRQDDNGKIVFTLNRQSFCRRELLPIYAAFAFALWEAISLLWASPDSLGFYSQHTTLLVMPIIGVCGLNKYYQWRQPARVLVLSTALSFFVYCFTFYWMNNIEYLTTPFFSGPTRPFTFSLFTLFGRIKHRMFHYIIVTIASILLCFLYKDLKGHYGKAKAIIIFVFFQVVFITTIILTESRTAVIAIPILAIVALAMTLRGRQRVITIAVTTAIACAAVVAVLAIHPRMRTFDMDQVTNIEQHLQDEETEPRLKIWTLALSEPSDYLLHGMGVGSATPYIIQKYKEHNLPYADFQVGIHPHNQYLEVTMELGIVAALLFLLCWILAPMCYTQKRARLFAALFSALIIVNMFFDCFFSVMQGMVYFGAMTILLLCLNKEQD